MKFDKITDATLDIMQALNDEKVLYDDTLVYFNLNGELFTCSRVELRYSEFIDRYAVVFTLDNPILASL